MQNFIRIVARAIIVFGSLLGIVAIISANKPKEGPYFHALAQAAIDSVAMQSAWQSIKINTANSHEYSFTLLYSSYPQYGVTEVETDTKDIARSMLRVLVNSGISPSTDGIGVSVTAIQAGIKGETGVNLFRDLGYTRYNHINDMLEYNR